MLPLQSPTMVRRRRRNRRDDRALIRLIQSLPSDACYVDVGANVGAVLAHMAASAPEGQHLAFEPLPDLAETLRARFPCVDVRTMALSTAVGSSEFVRPDGLDAYSGLRERDYPRAATLSRLHVDVSTLDIEIEDRVPTLVKIDVEGGEHDVLAGGINLLEKHRPLVAFEHGPRACENYGVMHEDVFDLLAGVGYAISDMDGVGPYSRDQFVSDTASFRRFNFLARPHG